MRFVHSWCMNPWNNEPMYWYSVMIWWLERSPGIFLRSIQCQASNNWISTNAVNNAYLWVPNLLFNKSFTGDALSEIKTLQAGHHPFISIVQFPPNSGSSDVFLLTSLSEHPWLEPPPCHPTSRGVKTALKSIRPPHSAGRFITPLR